MGIWSRLARLKGLARSSSGCCRRTAVSRRDPAEKDVEQVLVSNVDVVAAVLALIAPPGRLARTAVGDGTRQRRRGDRRADKG